LKYKMISPSNSLTEAAYKNNLPLYTVFELTHRCNLKCLHCYLIKQNKSELNTKEVKTILDKLARAGCLYLCFTGGEIFLRKDLLELCAYARKLNFDLRLFSNGTLITKEHAKMLSEIGLSAVEISLYGRKKSHEQITAKNNSFKKTLVALKLLKKYKVPVRIKAPLLNINFNDYKWLIKFAKKNKFEYRLDPVLAPQNNGDCTIQRFQLSAEKLKTIYTDKKLNKYLINQYEVSTDVSLQDVPDLFCNAGKVFAGISPQGIVYPCLQLLYPLGNLKNQSFRNIWHKSKKAKRLRKYSTKDCKECLKCSNIKACRRCPGIALLETGKITGKSKTACKIAEIQSKIQ